MKKLISLVILTALLFSLTTAYAWDENYLDPMNNELFNVVAPIKDVDTDDGHDHGKLLEMYVLSNYPGATLVELYSDGCRVSTKVLEGEEYNGYIELATHGYPAYLESVDGDKFIRTEEGSADGVSVRWLYLVTVAETGITEELVATEQSTVGKETGKMEYIITLYGKDENGNDVETVVDGCPMDYNAYSDFVYGVDTYNDGLIYRSRYRDESLELSGYYDINGEAKWIDGELTYYGMSYNLGYYLEGENNGGGLDWSQGDVEHLRRYKTRFTNSSTNETYSFNNTCIEYLMDSGYAVMWLKDDNIDAKYLIKLKKPAITTVFLNDAKICFDQLPVIENGRTLVPLRAIFEAIGADVSWDGDTNTVTAVKDNTEIKLTIDSTTAYKNGEAVSLDVPAKLLNGRTLVPVRFIGEAFGVKVDWIGEEMKVILTQE